jgi:hypothetical protein
MSLNRKHWHLALIGAGGVLMVVGCGKSAEEEPPAVTIDPAQVVTLQADASLQQVQDVAPSGNGEIWVLQREVAPHVFIYSEDGHLQDSFGMSGPALTQLSNPFWLVPTGDARRPMAVWDVGNRRIAVYSPDARLVASHEVQRSRSNIYRDIEQESFGKPLFMSRFGDGYVLMDHPRGLSSTIDYLRSELLLIGANGGSGKEFIDFGREFSAGIAALGNYVLYLVPIPLWTTCSIQELVLFDPFASWLRWYGPDGSELASDSVPLRSREMTEEDQRAFAWHRAELAWRRQTLRELDTAVIERSVDDHVLKHWNQYPEMTPYAVGIMCGADRQVWLQEFSMASSPLGLSAVWSVYQPGRDDLIRVRFPETFRPIRLSDGRIFGVSTNESGAQMGAYVPIPDLSTTATPATPE